MRRRRAGTCTGAGTSYPELNLDFVPDQLVTGRRFRLINIVDDVTRKCFRAVVDTSISGRRVVRELTYLDRGA